VIVPVYGDFSLRLKDTKKFGGILVELIVKWGNAPTASMIEETLEKGQM
jgi:hypothetical protein